VRRTQLRSTLSMAEKADYSSPRRPDLTTAGEGGRHHQAE
jgi:hypothetical protein